ncbi:MAG: hypothetical protein JF593_12265 [Novosphingobium sp.]|nr:hypothetical protein [Novosphingobium sp.]
MKKLTIAAAVLAASVAGTAYAQSGPRDPFGDATVARADAQTQAAARFDALDTNHDGVLSPDELAAMRPARAGGEGARPEGDRPEGGRRWGGGGGMGGLARMAADGKITKDVFVSFNLRRFDMMDANHDGQLTKAERDTFREAMRQRFASGGFGGGAGGFGGGAGGYGGGAGGESGGNGAPGE